MSIGIKVRGENVLLRILQKQDQKAGNIVIPGHLESEIEHAIVVGYGPGIVSAAGGIAGTHDLHDGDYVLAHTKVVRKTPDGRMQYSEKRVPITIDGQTLYLVDQSQIIAILTKPELRIDA